MSKQRLVDTFFWDDTYVTTLDAEPRVGHTTGRHAAGGSVARYRGYE